MMYKKKKYVIEALDEILDDDKKYEIIVSGDKKDIILRGD